MTLKAAVDPEAIRPEVTSPNDADEAREERGERGNEKKEKRADRTSERGEGGEEKMEGTVAKILQSQSDEQVEQS